MIFNFLVWSGLMLGIAADLIKSPSISDKNRRVPTRNITKRQSQRFIVDEVSDDDSTGRSRSAFTGDDYTDFNNLPVANRVNHKLRQVTYQPILPTYSTPNPVPRRTGDVEQATPSPATAPPIDPRAIRRTGFAFQHYPYDKLHRFYLLNPRIEFVYPREYENTEWVYPIERAPYFHERQFYNLAALGYYGRK
ncbi:hypothetical protein FO519_000737 [Halicephalobus sp. NKZ332]|nr:hypothetical protein FO519_000737 [Halicephalobus sp. NKZ332]